MKSAIAIKRFMEAEPNGRPCSAAELKGFKDACTSDEYAALGRQAAEAIGEPWEPSNS